MPKALFLFLLLAFFSTPAPSSDRLDCSLELLDPDSSQEQIDAFLFRMLRRIQSNELTPSDEDRLLELAHEGRAETLSGLKLVAEALPPGSVLNRLLLEILENKTSDAESTTSSKNTPILRAERERAAFDRLTASDKTALLDLATSSKDQDVIIALWGVIDALPRKSPFKVKLKSVLSANRKVTNPAPQQPKRVSNASAGGGMHRRRIRHWVDPSRVVLTETSGTPVNRRSDRQKKKAEQRDKNH